MNVRFAIMIGTTTTLPWTAGPLRDLALWPANLGRDFPARAARLGQTLAAGAAGLVRAAPAARLALVADDPQARAARLNTGARVAVFWLATFGTRLFDLVGGPELGELLLHSVTRASPLKDHEVQAAMAVLGPRAIRWGEVRVAEGGWLRRIFQRNQQRAFTTWHTINLPDAPGRGRDNLSIVVHELTHVRQYELLGSVYIIRALRDQATAENYDYGGATGLLARRAQEKRFWDLNLEQQASVAQHFFSRYLARTENDPVVTDPAELHACYAPWIDELRAGRSLGSGSRVV